MHTLARGGTDVIERALESAHAVAYVKKAAETGELGDVVVINLSGRGDKDVDSVAKREGF